MPELPEVETTRRGIAPYLLQQRWCGAVVRQPQLRQPVSATLDQQLRGREIHAVERRAKYLLIHCDGGYLLLHLGMSGSLRILPVGTPPGPHDHVDLCFESYLLRYRDPRRFGLLLWCEQPPQEHPLLRHLGPEPLAPAFSAESLHHQARQRKTPVKALIMEQRVVVGVGNIYANEALYLAAIDPRRAARRIALVRYQRLVVEIRAVLQRAIAMGGTTLRDFQHEDGKPGYFQQTLHVYGRGGAPCHGCGQPLRSERIAQRSSFFCPRCQR